MQVQIIQLPKFLDDRGNLSFFENNKQIPFEIKRVHWIYDVPGGEKRGGLAYKETEEFIIAMSGSFDVLVDDGKEVKKFSLNRSYMGLYIPKGMWRTIENFSTNSIAVIAASTSYDANDAIREYSDFLNYIPVNVEKNEESNIHIQNSSKIKHSVYDCNIIEFDKHHSARKGNISVVENNITVPFATKRIYYLYEQNDVYQIL